MNYTKLCRLPKERVVAALKNVKFVSMRAVMANLGMNGRSGSSAERLRDFAKDNGINISRFSAGSHDQSLVGMVFGMLTVVAPAGRSDRLQKLWLCHCTCGNSTVDCTAALKGGYRHHCGCVSYKFGSQSRNWKGYAEIPANLWTQFKQNAKSRNILFTVTIEQAWNAFVVQDRKCVFTGEKLVMGTRGKGTASLDRINSAADYSVDNVQWVHKTINVMKWTLSSEEFLAWCNSVSNFYGKLKR